MEFKVLGPLLIADGSRSVELRAAKQRALLAVLLCCANIPVSVDRLLDSLWGDDPPRTAPENLRLYVYQLRRVLGDAGRIVRRPLGYTLLVEPGELDVARFEEQAARGQKALRAGDPDRAGGLLREALTLWRGRPYADLCHVPMLLVEADRLQERRMSVLDARIEADLALGRHHDLVAELSELVTRYPMRERLRGHLMLALYRAGRQADALAAYRDGHRLLARELGLEPGPELRDLERSILNGDPTLAVPAGQPVVPQGAERRVPVPRQLPAQTPHFVGREEQLRRLSTMLDLADDRAAATIVAVNGTAGVGKTALAVRWAHQAATRFPDGQLYANLCGFDPGGRPLPPAEAIHDFLDAFGVPPERIPPSLDAKAALFRSLLAGRKVLVLLDNARDIDQVRPLLPGTPGCLTVITSRTRLVSLIAREGASTLTLDVLAHHEATALLGRYLGHDRIGGEPRAVDDIVARCARLPLALAIVAARAAAHPGLALAVLAEELRDEQRRLDGLDAGDDSTSVRAVLSWSYQHLPAAAARLFRLLGGHPGPDISLPAAASLAGVPLERARAAVGELTDAHLLDQPVPGRYTCHDLLRAYANEQARGVDTEDERRAAMRRVLDHYLRTADTADRLLDQYRGRITLTPTVPGVVPQEIADEAAAWAWFEAEHLGLPAIIAHAAATGFDGYAWRLCWLLATFVDRRGHWEELAATARIALAAARRAEEVDGQGRISLVLARTAALLGRFSEAHAHLRQARDLYWEAGDVRQLTVSHCTTSWVCEQEGRLHVAIGHAQHSLELAEDAGNQVGAARALNVMGRLHARLGDHGYALRCCQRALELHRALGDRLGVAQSWASLGYAHHELGEYPEAVTAYRHALALYRELHHRYDPAITLVRLGDTHQAAGHAGDARESWRQAVQILDDLRHPHARQVRARLTGPRVTVIGAAGVTAGR